jgi:hypothetical protein
MAGPCQESRRCHWRAYPGDQRDLGCDRARMGRLANPHCRWRELPARCPGQLPGFGLGACGLGRRHRVAHSRRSLLPHPSMVLPHVPDHGDR